ncbi:MAG: alpha/beta hydrolase [Bdellovibrionales bacterium]|nr:alpha/beta hydrolase [Bdellovibrionales bacterium]
MKSRTWILLRGLAREKGHWGPFAESFQSAFKNDEVLMIDLPGTGENRHLPSPTNIGGIFEFVRGQAVERAQASSTFTPVALSLGAMVAMEWMKRRPADLAGAVLINTSSKALSPVYHRLRWQMWCQFLRVVTMPSPRDRERTIIDMMINSEEMRVKALPVWAKVATDHPVSYRNMASQLAAAAFYEGLDQPTNVPVLLLNSLGDRFVDPSCSTALHEKWGWPIERHSWGGHDLPWDDADWIIQKIKAWCSANGAGRN